MGSAAEKRVEEVKVIVEQVWFTTTEAAKYLRTTPKALRMRVARGSIVPDTPGGRGRSKEHIFSRATLDAHYTGKR